MTGARTQIAIVGCGNAAQRHASNLRKSANAEIAGCYDARREATEAFALAHSTRAFDSLDALLDANPDGVVICTPPSTHVAIAEAVLERGIRVLCEKPLAPTTSECESLTEARGLACAFKFRHLKGARTIRDHVATGGLGRVLAIRGSALSDISMAGKWFSDPSLSGGGVLLDNGVHLIDLCHYLVGPTESVSATIMGGSRKLAVEESASIHMRMACGATAEILVSWEAPAPMPPLVEIWGTEGYASLGYDYQILDSQKNCIRAEEGNGLCVWNEVITNFVGFVRNETQPMARFEDGFAAVAVAEAAYASAVTHAWETPSQYYTFVR
ncbi:MAG: Gfo/Idh/MocA family oxidoreductase [Phycisphaerales bacterium]|nr:Gfo/Idh/MocA family oxidoreductase [Phycisphaerales bacterium]MCB9856200.1 Gfo/Idh/MocA family oxidoreductase [Phycisphaerales bacterium]MCB9863361.1 Gfo/Idh/MocA family oxidoreductase [Phycisphaerales bacterium]